MKKTKIYYFRRGVVIAIALISCLVFCQKENTTEAGNGNNNDTIPVPEGWTLVWNDEFNGSVIDPDHWEHEVNADGGGNNELQYYTDREENSWVEDGFLTIQALKEHYTGSDGTREYTSARIRTAGKGDWRYGRFEIRAKLPEGQGLWPAIWMLSTYGNYGGWAASGEIDIMEERGQEPDKVYGTLHYGASYPNNVQQGRSYILPQGTFADDFHTFILEWDTTRFQWFVDDSLYSTITSWYTEGHGYPAPFDQKFHLIFNVAVGGNWPGSPDAATEFPQQMVVDYARVFQKEE